jgi:acetoin utilization protein AcuB
MLTASLIQNNLPQLKLTDTVVKALQLIQDYKLTHLPVVEQQFLGLVSEDDLLETDEFATIHTLQLKFIRCFVLNNQHFLTAVAVCNQFETQVVPVLNTEQQYLGAITVTELLKTLGNFTGTNELGGIIIFEADIRQFSISEISRIVESNNATILHLNTVTNSKNGLLEVTIHLNKKEISDVVAAFERYSYTILHHFGAEAYQDDMKYNYQNLMNYLDI